MPTISQYYSTENNQADNSNGLPVIFSSSFNFFFLLKKWDHSHKTIKQPFGLKLRLIYLKTELLGPLMTSKLNFTSGIMWDSRANSYPKEGGYAYAMVHSSKR